MTDDSPPALQVQKFWRVLFSVYKSFLLLPKATTTQTARKTCAENPIRLTIFSKVRKKQKGLLAGVGQQASPRAHVFLRMHKDDVQNALMKNALDVSCSSRTYWYQLSLKCI